MQSRLMKIMSRLEAMYQDRHIGDQKRTFEQFGIPVCEVTYHQATGVFEVQRVGQVTSRIFDDLDLVAIEVYDAIKEFENIY
ncbi:DUF1797 family protein [Limosilactobacillus equigenerosi]|uniref:DUF1797 domain-containing protein n=1 Tax=Limosilactobacillus equigenerosi DSM 18793 = JCM 14505 TaxID=1423742 RepID=A0A0R1UT85_9LACO|nr:DUF1797 family protein [Limosilactobacillus equigenerosi]KRL96400.1 hypothetical protein FC21_GL000016 [Limosilactobacillus equigenerosi DSM 18793 = JCM 14505]MCQ2570483.1 YkuJ family protein [Limosilactobacillus sp.]